MSEDKTGGIDRNGPREMAELLKLRIPVIEPEEVERIAERETECIEFEAELASNPDKWTADP